MFEYTPLTSGRRTSSCSAIMSMGKLNTSVLPLPVNATPIMSLPDKIIGSPCGDNNRSGKDAQVQHNSFRPMQENLNTMDRNEVLSMNLF